MRVNDPDGLPVGINRRDAAPAPTGLAEIAYGFAFDGLRLRWPIYAEYQRKLGVIRFALCFIGLRPT